MHYLDPEKLKELTLNTRRGREAGVVAQRENYVLSHLSFPFLLKTVQEVRISFLLPKFMGLVGLALRERWNGKTGRLCRSDANPIRSRHAMS